MIFNQVPRKLWDHVMQWVCKTMQRTSTQSGGIDGCTPIESVTGKTWTFRNIRIQDSMTESGIMRTQDLVNDFTADGLDLSPDW